MPNSSLLTQVFPSCTNCESAHGFPKNRHRYKCLRRKEKLPPKENVFDIGSRSRLRKAQPAWGEGKAAAYRQTSCAWTRTWCARSGSSPPPVFKLQFALLTELVFHFRGAARVFLRTDSQVFSCKKEGNVSTEWSVRGFRVFVFLAFPLILVPVSPAPQPSPWTFVWALQCLPFQILQTQVEPKPTVW